MLLPDGEPEANMTPVKCANLSRLAGYTIYAMQNSYQCFAGTDLRRAMSLGPSRRCDPCPSDPSRKCGGPWSNSIYILGSYASYTDGRLVRPPRAPPRSPPSPQPLPPPPSPKRPRRVKRPPPSPQPPSSPPPHLPPPNQPPEQPPPSRPPHLPPPNQQPPEQQQPPSRPPLQPPARSAGQPALATSPAGRP
ncbi:hypothetical protein PLESTM_002020600 [Pleodorina starrii]|nr:hypothetical protein PLESTM_002020600 [Pleodorina starrii]